MCASYQPIEEKKQEMLRLWVFLLSLSTLTGCAFTAPITTEMSFSPKITKISKHVLLDIPQDTKDYVAKEAYGGTTWQVPLGQAIEPNALTAFNSVITDVTIKKDAQPVDRVIVLSITEGTGIELGPLRVSKNTFKTAIKCDVKMPDGKVVWSKNVYAQSSAQRAGEVVASSLIPILGIFTGAREISTGDTGYTGALLDAANDSLAQALHQLIDEIYKAKDEIF